MTRTSFDMDPFVVTSLGKKTYRTKVVRHNLNPVFDEKLVFQVLRHETNYSVNFAVVDRDKLSGNDYIGTANFPLGPVQEVQPEADPETGLFRCPDPPDGGGLPIPQHKRSRFKLGMSRSSSQNNLAQMSRNNSSTNLNKLVRTPSNTSLNGGSFNGGSFNGGSFNGRPRPHLRKEESTGSLSGGEAILDLPSPPTSQPMGSPGNGIPSLQTDSANAEDPDLRYYSIPLDLKKKERWEDKHNPILHVRAKYLPYQALRQQFWRAMLKQYDADDSGKIDKVELTTMLDTLGSTLHNATIDAWFSRFARENNNEEYLTMDQAVICLEGELKKHQGKTHHDWIKGHIPATQTASTTTINNGENTSGTTTPYQNSSSTSTPLNNRSETSIIPALEVRDLSKDGEEGTTLPDDDLAGEEKGEEHVIEISECPICHQPRLDKKNSEADIITHIATCASQDWRAVNNIVMAGFVTSSQAQRKWYSKVITKIGYGGYKLGANSANILVQDRITGQINEERMSVYVRLGIRLLYKGLKSGNMEKKRSMASLATFCVNGWANSAFSSSSQTPSFPFLQAGTQIR